MMRAIVLGSWLIMGGLGLESRPLALRPSTFPLAFEESFEC